MDNRRLGSTGLDGRWSAPELFGRIITFAVGALLLVAALMFSALLFAAALTAGLIVFGRIWWKTRELRKRMRADIAAGHQPFGRPPHSDAPGSRVIEGEAVRES